MSFNIRKIGSPARSTVRRISGLHSLIHLPNTHSGKMSDLTLQWRGVAGRKQLCEM